MKSGIINLAQSGLLLLDPERAHEITLRALQRGIHPRSATDDERLHQTVWGINFPNPIGMAAGFDKNARVPGPLLAMGFGFTEVGTVTPLPQPGNPRPRVFRLSSEQAVINRMGFNGDGHNVALERLRHRPPSGIIGVNIGANKTSEDPTADYCLGLRTFTEVADYFTINISSPNTPGLRDLQAPDRLNDLLTRLMAEREEIVSQGRTKRPILVKLAPDIHDDDLTGVVYCMMAHSVDGVILTNTTIARDGVQSSRYRDEVGGLSGRPLFERATRMLAKVYQLTEGQVPLIGVGGIDSGETALAKIQAGASLLQLYTGMIYRGAGLLTEIKNVLVKALEEKGANSLEALRGQQAEKWAERPLT